MQFKQYKVITDRQLKELEKLLHSGWELFNVAACDRQIVYLLRRR